MIPPTPPAILLCFWKCPLELLYCCCTLEVHSAGIALLLLCYWRCALLDLLYCCCTSEVCSTAAVLLEVRSAGLALLLLYFRGVLYCCCATGGALCWTCSTAAVLQRCALLLLCYWRCALLDLLYCCCTSEVCSTAAVLLEVCSATAQEVVYFCAYSFTEVEHLRGLEYLHMYMYASGCIPREHFRIGINPL